VRKISYSDAAKKRMQVKKKKYRIDFSSYEKNKREKRENKKPSHSSNMKKNKKQKKYFNLLYPLKK